MIWDNLALAFGGIVANKVRSFLTMLSIGIGVFAVITLMAVAAGAAQATQGQLDGLGSPRLITVYGTGGGGDYYGGVPQPMDEAGDVADGGPDAFDLFDPRATAYTPPPPQPLSEADVALLNDGNSAPDVAAAAGYFSSYAPVTSGTGGYADSEIIGTNPFYARASGLAMTDGTFLLAGDVTSRARVTVLNTSGAEQLQSGVGDTVTLQGTDYDVIGVIEDTYPGQAGAYLPETTMKDTLLGPQVGYQQVYVLAEESATVEPAAQQVREVLRESHLLGPTDPADFEVYTRTADLASVRAVTTILQVLAAGIASIALFVAGIGVMNIMLVTVTERTREIGIRKAIGAQHHHLLGQFLLEAVVLTFTGGLIGMLLGTLTQFIEIQGFSPVVTPFSIVLSLSFSIATGLFFGLYPANRAASLPPIQALRYE